MKKTLLSLMLPALLASTLQLRAQDPDVVPPTGTNTANNSIKMIKPGDFKIDQSRIPSVDVTYKVAVTKGAEKKDGGLLTEKFSIDKKKNQLTVIKTHKQEKDLVIDTAIIKLENFELVYHSKTDKSNKIFKNYRHQPKSDTDLFFDLGLLNYFFTMLPDEKFEPGEVAVFSINAGSVVKSSIVNVKDDMSYGSVSSDDGVYVVDYASGSDLYRLAVNKKTHRTEIIEHRQPDGTMYEYMMVK